MTPFSALVVGEALMDVVHAEGAVQEHAGGSAANTALALARLDVPTSLVTRLADDDFGRRIAAHLEGNDVTLVGPYAGMARTSSAVATIGAGGAASYDFDIEWDLPPVVLPGGLRPTLVHTCSLAAVLAPGCDRVAELVSGLAEGAAVSYDLNLRPGVTGSGPEITERVHRMVALADLVKASDEDLAALHPDLPLADAAGLLLELGPAAVVVTQGGAGASWFGRHGTVHVAAAPVDVVDTVGAGDTFGAGLLVALGERGLLVGDGLAGLDPDGWREVLEFAGSAARVTVSRPGADPPRRSDLG